MRCCAAAGCTNMNSSAASATKLGRNLRNMYVLASEESEIRIWRWSVAVSRRKTQQHPRETFIPGSQIDHQPVLRHQDAGRPRLVAPCQHRGVHMSDHHAVRRKIGEPV